MFDSFLDVIALIIASGLLIVGWGAVVAVLMWIFALLGGIAERWSKKHERRKWYENKD